MTDQQVKTMAIMIAREDGASRASLITGIPVRTIYYWLQGAEAALKDAQRRERAAERRRKEAEAAEAAIEEAAMLRSKLVDMQAEVEALQRFNDKLADDLEVARNTAQTLNDHIHNHYPFGKVLDLTGDTHGA